MTVIFHDMLHRCLEDYVDDIVVKPKEVSQHVNDLRRVFTRCREYNLRMSPLKCAFRVASRRFLGFTIRRKGIDLDPAKVKAIRDMKPPKTIKQLKSCLGRVLLSRIYSSWATRAIPETLEERCVVLVGRGVANSLPKGQGRARIFTISLVKGLTLTLYLTSTNKYIGALLAQVVEGVERPVCYLSQSLHGAKLNYLPIERHCLVFIFATKKRRHYFIVHPLHLVTKLNPLRYLLSIPTLAGRIARWMF